MMDGRSIVDCKQIDVLDAQLTASRSLVYGRTKQDLNDSDTTPD